ncbi:MAG: hypothetical protein HQK76_18445 [Desulfobacterales bacterium]|nr:hypothetical protein [Desulfobacterales bacterium]
MCSCATYQARMNQEWEVERQLSLLDINTLNGQYSNEMKDKQVFLWNLLTSGQSFPKNVVELKIINEKRIRAILKSEGYKSIETEIDCNINSHHLELRTRQGFLKPAFPLFWLYYSEQILLGLTPENELSVLRHASATIFVGPMPIFGGGSGPGVEYRYKKNDTP